MQENIWCHPSDEADEETVANVKALWRKCCNVVLGSVLRYIYRVNCSGVRGSGGPRSCYSCFTWMLWNSPAVLLVLPAFDDTESLGYSPRQVLYPVGSTRGDFLPFLCGELGEWAKTNHFLFTCTFPCFPVFPLLLTTPPPTQGETRGDRPLDAEENTRRCYR